MRSPRCQGPSVYKFNWSHPADGEFQKTPVLLFFRQGGRMSLINKELNFIVMFGLQLFEVIGFEKFYTRLPCFCREALYALTLLRFIRGLALNQKSGQDCHFRAVVQREDGACRNGRQNPSN